MHLMMNWNLLYAAYIKAVVEHMVRGGIRFYKNIPEKQRVHGRSILCTGTIYKLSESHS